MNVFKSIGSQAVAAKMKPARKSLAQATLDDLFTAADIAVDGARPWDIRVHDRRFYNRVLSEGTLGFGESYMEEWWDCDALDELCYRAFRAKLDERLPLNLKTALAAAAAAIFNLQSKRRARRVGRHHYDLGNDFFEAMLDPAMQYSCAYFRGTRDLAEAQRHKLDLICRKLGLEAGMRLLDIGCGWGGLAQYAARHYGCRVVGITISREQHAYATASCQGLPIEIRLQDYRDVSETFDRIVSVGMVEHVGYKNFRSYMQTAFRCLKNEGLFLCHTIGCNGFNTHSDPWIARYIFPNSMVPSATQITQAAEGLFTVEDVHNFGADYDHTLMAWEENFRRSWDGFKCRYGERFYRMWRFYLLSCAGAFRARNLQLFQFVFSKSGILHGYHAPRF